MLSEHASPTLRREHKWELGVIFSRKPFWGRGYLPEAAAALIRRGFQELGMTTIWCGYYDGNVKSKRVQEKLGFVYHHTCEAVPVPLLHEVRAEHTTCLTKAMWEIMQQG